MLAPAHLGPVFRSRLFSPLGKLRIALEPYVAARTGSDDESLDSFVTRRLGREVLDRVAQALAGGIYTADPKRLSMAATMPRFVEMERRYGSVVKGMRAAEDARAAKSFRRERRALEPVPELQERNGDAARDARDAARRVDSQGRRSRRDVAQR